MSADSHRCPGCGVEDCPACGCVGCLLEPMPDAPVVALQPKRQSTLRGRVVHRAPLPPVNPLLGATVDDEPSGPLA